MLVLHYICLRPGTVYMYNQMWKLLIGSLKFKYYNGNLTDNRTNVMYGNWKECWHVLVHYNIIILCHSLGFSSSYGCSKYFKYATHQKHSWSQLLVWRINMRLVKKVEEKTMNIHKILYKIYGGNENEALIKTIYLNFIHHSNFLRPLCTIY
jgi:hypothetical protein